MSYSVKWLYYAMYAFVHILSGCNGSSGESLKDQGFGNGFSNLIGLSECTVVDDVSGTICGTILKADLVTPLEGVKIYLPGVRGSSSCITNALGQYFCHVPKERSKGALTVMIFDPPWRPKKNVAMLVNAGVVNAVGDYALRWGWGRPE